jgi:hypothetical protein
MSILRNDGWTGNETGEVRIAFDTRSQQPFQTHSEKCDESGMGRDESGFLGRIGRAAGTNRARWMGGDGGEQPEHAQRLLNRPARK